MITKKRVNISVDEDIHREFKSVCAKLGLTVSEVIQTRMEDYAKAYHKVKNSQI